MSPPAADPQQALREGMAELLDLRRARLDAGERPVGWKVGVNDPRGQAHLGLTDCVFGFMTSGGRIEQGRPLALPDDLNVSAEAEIGIVLADDLPAGVTPEQAEAAIAGITPTIEIVEPARPFTDLRTVLGHNVWHVAVAARTSPDDLRPGASLDGLALTFRRNGQTEAEVKIPNVLPPLGKIVSHAADFLGQFGLSLKAGDLLISGACAPAKPLEPGDRIEADFAGLGAIAVRREPARGIALD